MSMSQDAIQTALGTVVDPDLGKDLVSLGLVQSITCDSKSIRIVVERPTPACPLKEQIRNDIITRLTDAGGEDLPPIEVSFVARPAGALDAREVLPGVTNVIAVGAGKGGVGKSTVSVLLATALTRLGASCGLLDGDIYGPSMSTMLGLDDLQPMGQGNTLAPFEVHGLKAMTIAKLVDPDKPMIWRGPMAHKAFSQLLLQTDWGALDFLIVDLPPGTGDIPLSLSQSLPLAGAVIVCTPQRVAQDDARRAVRMFGQLDVPVLGVVENMSWFVGNDGTEYDLFGRGGAQNLAKEMSLPFLGGLPLHIAMREHGDAGTPLKNYEIDDSITEVIEQIAGALARQTGIAQAARASAPTISVS